MLAPECSHGKNTMNANRFPNNLHAKATGIIAKFHTPPALPLWACFAWA